MKFSLKHLVAGFIGNLLVVIAGAIGLVMFFTDPAVDILGALVYFTMISNIFVIVLSFINAIVYLVSIAKKHNYVSEFLQVLKLIAVSAVMITFTMVIIFLIPHDTTGFNFYAGFQLFMHMIVPLVAAFSFIFLEYSTKIRFRFFFMPIIFVVLYGVFYVLYGLFAPAGTFVDWYGFMFPADARIAPVDTSKFMFGTFFLFLGESFGGAVAFGFVLWLLNKIANLLFIGYTLEGEKEPEYYDEVELPKEEEKKEEAPVEEEPKKTTTKAKTSSKSRISAPKKYKDGARVYHISRSKFVSRSWQVKLATGEKAIKVFPTQAEAIEYAKKLTRTQGGSIRIHSMRGQLRK